MLLVEKHFSLLRSSLNLPLLAFILVTFISLIWSNLFRDPFVVTWPSFPFVQLASTIVIIVLPLSFLITANFINSEKNLRIIVTVMLVAGFFGLFRQFGNIPQMPVNTGGLFIMWIISLSVGQALFNNKLNLKWRIALLILAGLWVYWGFVLNISWLAGWIPGFIVLGILALSRSWKLTSLLVVLFLIYIVINLDYYINTVLVNERSISGVTRLDAWIVNWKITNQHLLFGTGPAGYAAYYMTYLPTEGMASHNNYIDVIAQTGLTGLVCIIWFFSALAWKGYRLVTRIKGRGDFLEGLAIAAFGGTIGCIIMMFFGDWLFPFAYTQTIAGFDYVVYNWIFMGTIIVIERLTNENDISYA